MKPVTPTIRSLARVLGLSHTTVSDALRGKGRVDPATIELIKKAAREAGYRRNPLAGAVMSEMRRSRGSTFRGVLAAVDYFESDRPVNSASFHQELLLGARARAADLGFKLEEFTAGREGMSVQRLDTIMRSRGIQGVMLLPLWRRPDWSKLEWSHYSAVYTDYIIERPALHCVCCNHYRSMTAILDVVTSRGYRRPGLYLEEHRDERTQRRFSASFRSFQENTKDVEHIPMLITKERDQKEFCAWFRRYDPDVVIGHFTETIDWMKACGAKVPGTHGFASLNTLYKSTPCAGLDQQPQELGARSAEMVVAQLQRNERGIPKWPTITTIPATWTEGPTIRKFVHKIGAVDNPASKL